MDKPKWYKLRDNQNNDAIAMNVRSNMMLLLSMYKKHNYDVANTSIRYGMQCIEEAHNDSSDYLIGRLQGYMECLHDIMNFNTNLDTAKDNIRKVSEEFSVPIEYIVYIILFVASSENEELCIDDIMFPPEIKNECDINEIMKCMVEYSLLQKINTNMYRLGWLGVIFNEIIKE